jgi:hypothetical protein
MALGQSNFLGWNLRISLEIQVRAGWKLFNNNLVMSAPWSRYYCYLGTWHSWDEYADSAASALKTLYRVWKADYLVGQLESDSRQGREYLHFFVLLAVPACQL